MERGRPSPRSAGRTRELRTEPRRLRDSYVSSPGIRTILLDGLDDDWESYATRHAGARPIVYYGAHPEGAGESECRKAGVVGMVLTLPFSYHYKNFRFVRALFPDVDRVFVPFYEGTIFCQPHMKTKHRSYRRSAPVSPWVDGDSDYVGYRSLSALCYIIGLEYREFVYRDLDELAAGLELVEGEGAMLMPYNDSVYCRGAPKTLTRFASVRRIPLLWNNNPEATRIGAVAAVAACFREAGNETGKMSAAILDGVEPEKLGLLASRRTFASLNSQRAQELGLTIKPKVLEYFDEVI